MDKQQVFLVTENPIFGEGHGPFCIVETEGYKAEDGKTWAVKIRHIWETVPAEKVYATREIAQARIAALEEGTDARHPEAAR